MLTFLIILALIAAATAAALFLRRKNRPAEMLDRSQISGVEHFRPLFAPTKDDLLEAERENTELLRAEEKRLADMDKRNASEDLERIHTLWLASPTRAQTISLLYEAAKGENGDIYLKACKDVLRVWRTGSVKDLSAADLAHLMESHYWLIPADKRTPGDHFLIKEEIAGLTREFIHNQKPAV
jgi:hypothetical protein